MRSDIRLCYRYAMRLDSIYDNYIWRNFVINLKQKAIYKGLDVYVSCWQKIESQVR